MNEMRKLMEAIERLNEANILSVENDEVEKHLDAAAKALAKDAVLQASGVWDEEGRDEGGYDTGAKSGKEYVSIAAPRFLDDEYKSSIMNSFENSFDNYVQHFLEYVGESVDQVNENDLYNEEELQTYKDIIADVRFIRNDLKDYGVDVHAKGNARSRMVKITCNIPPESLEWRPVLISAIEEALRNKNYSIDYQGEDTIIVEVYY